MRVFLAGTYSRTWVFAIHSNEDIFGRRKHEKPYNPVVAGGGQNEMKLFLAGVAPWKETGLYNEAISKHKPYILESYYYADETTEKLMPFFGDFLLDSGAFTFMSNTAGNVDWVKYMDGYIDFINRNKVSKFFELDVDSICGYNKVKDMRKYIEQGTGKKVIPVWHKSRGQSEFIKMCEEYDYVAIGGIVSKEIMPVEYKYFPWFIKTAHEHGAKIHGLGFTSLNGIKKYHFDSVDSTAWTTGNRFGYVYKFNGKDIIKIDPPKGYKLGNTRAVALNNYIEWIKFQRYAERNL